ncbi:MAG: DJ-1/PfpI family protein [Muribaculaceae bacterium]|nr:DJ-1/PfpI family protein [Muribaculaceae bacterium]
MKKSYLFLAPGFEEIEALATVDVLRRSGMEVITVAVGVAGPVVGAHGIPVVADTSVDQLPDELEAEWLIAPGGMPGASNLAACDKLCAMLKAQSARGGHIAAICAAPAVVLAPLGLLEGRNATCYPGFENQCEDQGAVMKAVRVVVDGNIITGNGPSSAIPFALAIAEKSMGKEVADSVAAGMLC